MQVECPRVNGGKTDKYLLNQVLRTTWMFPQEPEGSTRALEMFHPLQLKKKKKNQITKGKLLSDSDELPSCQQLSQYWLSSYIFHLPVACWHWNVDVHPPRVLLSNSDRLFVCGCSLIGRWLPRCVLLSPCLTLLSTWSSSRREKMWKIP